MTCTSCEGRGIVPASSFYQPEPWDGEERRVEERRLKNSDLKFGEVEAALYQSCSTCDGSGIQHQNLLSFQH